jgi:very-short-patch-repair endonuclease
VCGKEMWLPNCLIGKKIACSKKCASMHLAIKYKGRKLTPEWQEKINVHKTKDKVIKYGVYVCDSCGKVFEKNTSLRSHHATCHQREKIFYCDKCEYTHKSPGALWLHKMRYHEKEEAFCLRSKPEIAFEHEIRAIIGSLNLEISFIIPGCNHRYDFCIPEKRIVIEFDGDYWHGNPKIFEPSERNQYQQNVDRYYTNQAIKAGYTVFRVWESETGEFLEKLRRIINGIEVCQD